MVSSAASLPGARMAALQRAGLALAFLVSGAGALMLEVVWNRRLHLLFGGSAVATSAVLAAYMGGLAAGSLWLAPVVRRRFHPALAYGVMELLIAGYALAVPWLLSSTGPLSGVLGLGDGPWSMAAVRFLAAGAVLLFPTSLMGATLPCLAALVDADVDDGEDRAGRVGFLYAANTLGAVAGTLGATYGAFPALGVNGTNTLAAGLDTLAGLFALTLWWRAGTPGPTPVPAPTTPAAAATPAALWLYGLSGAVAMALEVLWARGLSMVVGSSVHAFSLMLAAFLTGLALGARLSSTPTAAGWHPRSALGLVLVGTGLAAFAGTWLIDGLPWVVFAAAKDPDVTPWGMWAAMLLCAVLTMVPAAIGFGAVLPCALRAAGVNARGGDFGSLVGRAYAINTGGAILGATSAGFLLAPALGVDHAAQSLSVVIIGAGAVWLASHRRSWALAALVSAALLALWPGFDVGQWSVGAFRVYLARTAWEDALPEPNVIFRRDGLATTVTVEEYEGRVSLKVNGKTDASSEGDMHTQVLSGLLPVLLHPAPHVACVIGFGSGVTADALLSHPGITRLEMVELEPAVVEAGELFAAVNRRPWEDPRYVGVFDDGRHHLERPGPPYDIIISEPSNPWITGASNLFTREFWLLARSRLAADGVFLQWVQLYELSSERIQSLMGTFATVFPHVLVFVAHADSNDTFMVGSNAPLVLDEDLLTARWEQPPVRWQLKRADIRWPLDVLPLVLLDRAALERFTAGFSENTDDNMYVELNAPQDLVAFAYREPELPFMRQVAGRRKALLSKVARLRPRPPDEQAVVLAEAMLRAGLVDDARALAVHAVGKGGGVEDRMTRVLEALDVLTGNDEIQVIQEDEQALEDPRYQRAAIAMIEGHDRKALEVFETFPDLEKQGHAYRLLYAYLLYRANWRWRAQQAVEPLLQDLPWRRAHPEVLYYGARMNWLEENNQRGAALALEYVDIQRARRALRVEDVVAP
ncbi:MAG: hypothetical protein HY904_07065 [Deltaproteobacteria bacterium]|nr:hypothetical protein [Deltaproteobacteria bacterium]